MSEVTAGCASPLDEAGLVVPVSDTFGERNQGQRVADAVAMAEIAMVSKQAFRFK